MQCIRVWVKFATKLSTPNYGLHEYVHMQIGAKMKHRVGGTPWSHTQHFSMIRGAEKVVVVGSKWAGENSSQLMMAKFLEKERGLESAHLCNSPIRGASQG